MAEVRAELETAYKTHVAKLNVRHWGLPQNRDRTYLVGILRSRQQAAFEWPHPPEDMLELEDILAPRTADDDPTRRPAARNAAAVAEVAARRAEAMGWREADWSVDTTMSAANVARGAAHPRPWCPCLLRGHATGPWLGARGRFATFSETARLQGVIVARYPWWPGTEAEKYALIGNSMAQCVIEPILAQLIATLRVHGKPRSKWATGQAQAELRAAAEAEGARRDPGQSAIGRALRRGARGARGPGTD